MSQSNTNIAPIAEGRKGIAVKREDVLTVIETDEAGMAEVVDDIVDTDIRLLVHALIIDLMRQGIEFEHPTIIEELSRIKY